MLRPAMIAVALGAFPTAAFASVAFQCPDGSPPPCRSAAAAPRRAPPPLDARTWIVLPFENVARAQDIDWLRDASVNLLYLDLSRWQDIRVVDDERVADLMREVPEVRAGAQLSLQTGMAVARRAGAGKLVMGDLLKVGNRTQFVAKVYDVRTGNRLRTVRQETAIADSIMPAFGRLARGILDVAPPAGASVGVIGTTSVEAYRAYVAGVSALNRVDLATAHAYLDTAIALDSGFALAHYKLAVVIGWEDPNNQARRRHAETASRNAAALPQRERALINGLVHQAAARWGEACEVAAQLIRADSNDVEAWYNLGECNYHDPRVLAESLATSGQFRGSWNLALRAFTRVLELDPTYHLAFSHIPDILQVDQRAGCRTPGTPQNCANTEAFLAYVVRDGDSLLLEPQRLAGRQDVLEQQRLRAARTGVWRTNLLASQRFAEAWVSAGPNEPRAHLALARVLMRLGNAPRAAAEFAQARIPPRSTIELQRYITDRLELLLKLDSASAAARFADSLAGAHPGRSGPGGSLPAFAAVMMGRFNRIDDIFGNFNGPPVMLQYFKTWPRMYAGVPPADMAAIERSLDSILVAQVPAAQLVLARTTWFSATIPWSLGVRRDPPPLLDTASADPRVAFAALAVLGDTAATRRALLRLDSSAMALPDATPDASLLLIAAEGWLLLGDSSRALNRMIEWDDRFPYASLGQTMHGNFGTLTVSAFTWGRGFLLLGDLAAAAGQRDRASRAYRQVTGMWSGADASLQPAVARARAFLGH